MKASTPQLLYIVCASVVLLLSSFRLGSSYTAAPYRALAATSPTRLDFTQIEMQRTRTMLYVSYVAFGFSALGFGFLLYAALRRKPSVHFATPQRRNKEALAHSGTTPLLLP
jgi:hypothetical protein